MKEEMRHKRENKKVELGTYNMKEGKRVGEEKNRLISYWLNTITVSHRRHELHNTK